MKKVNLEKQWGKSNVTFFHIVFLENQSILECNLIAQNPISHQKHSINFNYSFLICVVTYSSSFTSVIYLMIFN